MLIITHDLLPLSSFHFHIFQMCAFKDKIFSVLWITAFIGSTLDRYVGKREKVKGRNTPEVILLKSSGLLAELR